MKNTLFTLAAAALLATGCSGVYKTGQTPDDIYYSYGPATEARQEREVRTEDNVYRSYWEEADDSYLRMKVRDRDRWSRIDDLDYWYGYNNPYGPWNNNWVNVGRWNGWNSWNVGMGWNSWSMWNSPWGMNSSLAWNRWNNPFYFNSFYNSWNNPWCWNQPVVVVNKFPTQPRSPLNTAGYRSTSGFDRSNNSIFGAPKSGAANNNRQSGGELFRSIFRSPEGTNSGSSNNNRSSSWDRPSRTFGSSSGSSSSGSSSSGSSRSSGSSSGGGGRRGN